LIQETVTSHRRPLETIISHSRVLETIISHSSLLEKTIESGHERPTTHRKPLEKTNFKAGFRRKSIQTFLRVLHYTANESYINVWS
jgi:hypothetical protein